MKRIIGLVAVTVSTAITLSACGPTLGDLPLPGTGVSGETITVTADFDEALNLAEGATVKVNGVNSGKVVSVSAKDFKAEVELKIQTVADVRDGATARLRYTTPLGELFVDVTNPTTGALMADGAELGTDDTSTAPTVEDALAQASLLVNGGGLAQLQTVTSELQSALGGRESTVRDLLSRTDVLLTQANATTADLDRALRALASVSTTLDQRKATINAALRDVRPAAKVLTEATPRLTELLSQLERFSDLANQTVGATKTQILSILRQVGPVLAEFAKNRTRFGPSLKALVTLGKTLDGVVPGDYLNIALIQHLDELDEVPNPLGTSASTKSTKKNGHKKNPISALNDALDLAGIGDLLGGILPGLLSTTSTGGKQ